MLGSFCDPGGILTPNRWSRNPVRYTVAPRSHFYFASEQLKYLKGQLRHGAKVLIFLLGRYQDNYFVITY